MLLMAGGRINRKGPVKSGSGKLDRRLSLIAQFRNDDEKSLFLVTFALPELRTWHKLCA